MIIVTIEKLRYNQHIIIQYLSLWLDFGIETQRADFENYHRRIIQCLLGDTLWQLLEPGTTNMRS